QNELDRLMDEKEKLEFEYCQLRLEVQRARHGRAEPSREEQVQRRMGELKNILAELDERISPIARTASEVGNALWGPLLRAGNDKSALARQLERSADIY